MLSALGPPQISLALPAQGMLQLFDVALSEAELENELPQ
jgi:hypothetical protein